MVLTYLYGQLIRHICTVNMKLKPRDGKLSTNLLAWLCPRVMKSVYLHMYSLVIQTLSLIDGGYFLAASNDLLNKQDITCCLCGGELLQMLVRH